MQDQKPISEQSGWERDLLLELSRETLRERRRARRWGIFFKLLTFAYLTFLLGILMMDGLEGVDGVQPKGPHTALVTLNGVIADDAEASADRIITALRNAFEDEQTRGVILRINSPGGSPVQSGYVYNEMKRLRKLHPRIPLYAVITDMGASGGYYIASAADEIYVDKASIIGSIGVVMGSFGLVDAMHKLGVERRLLTAGEYKGILDPFSPLKKGEREHLQGLLNRIHQQFIDAVKSGRGDRLKDDPRIFSGLFWTGEQGVELGLADGIGSSSYVARELIGEEKIVDYSVGENLLERFAKRLGMGAASMLARQFSAGSNIPVAR